MTNPLVKRDAQGRIIAGVCNPKGRPKTGLSLAETIREVLATPQARREFVQSALDIAFGRAVCIDPAWQLECAEARRKGEPMPPRPTDAREVVQPTLNDMQRAREWLANWGFEKPTQTMEITGPDGGTTIFDYAKLSPAELTAHENLLRKMAGLDPLAPGEAR